MLRTIQGSSWNSCPSWCFFFLGKTLLLDRWEVTSGEKNGQTSGEKMDFWWETVRLPVRIWQYIYLMVLMVKSSFERSKRPLSFSTLLPPWSTLASWQRYRNDNLSFFILRETLFGDGTNHLNNSTLQTKKLLDRTSDQHGNRTKEDLSRKDSQLHWIEEYLNEK